MEERKYKLFFSYDNSYGIFRSRTAENSFAPNRSENCDLVYFDTHECCAVKDVLTDIWCLFRSGKYILRRKDVVCMRINGVLLCYSLVSFRYKDLKESYKNFRCVNDFITAERESYLKSLHKDNKVLSIMEGKPLSLEDIATEEHIFYAISSEGGSDGKNQYSIVREDCRLYMFDGRSIFDVNPYNRPFLFLKTILFYLSEKMGEHGSPLLLTDRRELEMVQNFYKVHNHI